MKKSYLKLSNLAFSEFNIVDFDNLLDLFFSNQLDMGEDLFYHNYALALDSFIKNNRSLFDNDNKELSTKLGYYIFCLYGKNVLRKYLVDLNIEHNYMNKIFAFASQSWGEKKDLPIYIHKLNRYFSYRLLEEKYYNIDMMKMKEAFDIFFNVDNFTEKYQNIQRKKEFIEREHIDEQTFKDYVCIYGFEHTSLKDTVQDVYVRQVSSYRNYGLNFQELGSVFQKDISATENTIITLLNMNNLDDLKLFVYSGNITDVAIYLIYDHDIYISKIYSNNKDEIIKKVNKATLELEKEYKYISISKIMSIIEKTDDEDLIYKIVKNNQNKNYDVQKFISRYRLLKPEQEQKQIEKELRFKINKAFQSIKDEKKRKKEAILKVENMKIIKSFHQLLDANYSSLKEFAKKNGFSYGRTMICFQILKQDNPSFYNEIKRHLDDLGSRKYKIILTNINKICDEIIHGINLKDGTKKEFDLLDYYLKTKLTFDEFNRLYTQSDDFSINDRRKIAQFLTKVKSNTYFNINQELESKTVLLVNNEMHTVTKDEKLSTIEYLKSKNIPLYYSVYCVALRRFVNGTLVDKEESKENVNILKKS